MKSIVELKNEYEGEDCLMIGGGPSVEHFDFSSIDHSVYRIGVNRQFADTHFDYIVYRDRFFHEWCKKKHIGYNAGMISVKDNPCDFFYVEDQEINWGRHTGYTALQIAQYMGFNNIYLIGYDYYCDEKLHYYENNENVEITSNERQTIISMLNKWIEDFSHTKWTANIINLNPKTKLKF